ncbi:MAG TPA: hypothetical protein DEF34_03460 [Desulfotomaculum sp.]|nr:hypothetical protein [Desulfotomaculum sp.]
MVRILPNNADIFTWLLYYASICKVIKLDLLNWGKLLVKIECERRRLYELSQLEPHNTDKLLHVSQRLDELINRYQREIKVIM